MKKNIKTPLCLLIILVVGFGCKTFSKLLVKNGTEFKIQIETTESDKDAVVQRAIEITKNKLNLIKLGGEVVKDPEDATKIIVRVYGSRNLEREKKFLFTSYRMELRKIISPANPSPVQIYPSAEAAKQVVKDDQDILPYPERSESKEQFVIVERNMIVNGDDIRDAQAFSRSKENTEYQISFSLKPEGAGKFGDWTGKNIGNYIAVILDKKVQSAAYIKSQIFDSGEISGRFTKEQAEDVAMSLKSGYLPATMKILEEKPIGND